MYAIITAPTVSYKCKILHKEEIKIVDNPLDSPPPELIEYWEEAIV
jgi:translation elongation factor EF-4